MFLLTLCSYFTHTVYILLLTPSHPAQHRCIYTYSLPVPDAKFQEAKSEGQLIVTPEMVAKKIKAMKDNKSPGVDGIPPKLLMETLKQISIPLARMFNLSLKEGLFFLNGKKQISYHYIKRVREISQRITDQ